MNERKTSQYLKYALGEIILVVAGILIAVSINNWRESLKRDAAELAALIEIQDGLTRDSSSIERAIGTLVRVEKGIKETQKYLNGKEVNEDSVGFNFGWTLFHTSFEPSLAPYESLKNQGLELISSSELRARAISYYETNSYLKEISQGTFLELNDFRRQSAHHFENIAFFDDISKDRASIRWMMPRNLNKLRQDNLYRTYLNTRLADIETMIYFTYEGMQESVEVLKDEVQKEISKLD